MNDNVTHNTGFFLKSLKSKIKIKYRRYEQSILGTASF